MDGWMYQIGMNDFGHVVDVDVHVDELLQVEVDFALGEREHPVADVRLNARLFRIEKIRHRVRHIEQFRFEPPQQPRLFHAAAVTVVTVVAVVAVVAHHHRAATAAVNKQKSVSGFFRFFH